MKKIKRILINMLMRLFGILPIKKNKIIFSSYHGTSYSCNPRCISEALQKKNKNLDIVWVLPPNYDVPDGVRVVQEKSIRGIYEYATAKVWVDNCRKSIWMHKRKKQYYIQTWHAGISNKLGEGYAQDELPEEYIMSAKHDSQMADLFLSNSRWLSESYRKCFWYKGKIFEGGLPREDVLKSGHETFHREICDFYGVNYNTKFVLYAPTFRNSGDLSVYNIDYERLISILNKDGNNWKIILRLHPNIQRMQTNIKYNDNILNGSKFAEINNLILASSLFISDYSSCMFDAMIAGCNVILYASDIENYENERGFAFKWSELPFLIATNNDELEQCIQNFDSKIYKEKVDLFSEQCGIYNKHNASEEVADIILRVVNGGNYK